MCCGDVTPDAVTTLHLCVKWMRVCGCAQLRGSLNAGVFSDFESNQRNKHAKRHERADGRHLPAGRRRQLLPLRQRHLVIASPRLRFRSLHARAGSRSAAEPAGSTLQRPAAHRQRRRTAPVLPLLGAQQPAEVSAVWRGASGRLSRQIKREPEMLCGSVVTSC